MKSIIGYNTDKGIKKETNQDSLCIKKASVPQGEIVLLAVCDGMGGLYKGEEASASVVNALSIWFEREVPLLLNNFTMQNVQVSLLQLIVNQNIELNRRGRNEGVQMGTTVNAMFVMPDGHYIIMNVGDSRNYKMDINGIAQLTEDQSVVARDVRKGLITKEQALTDPRRSVLLQCVGVTDDIEPDFYYGVVKPSDMYLICSDGFVHEIKEEEIYREVAIGNMSDSNAISLTIEGLVSTIKDRGEKDNITAIICRWL